MGVLESKTNFKTKQKTYSFSPKLNLFVIVYF